MNLVLIFVGLLIAALFAILIHAHAVRVTSTGEALEVHRRNIAELRTKAIVGVVVLLLLMVLKAVLT